ncbi:hypothetical protein CLU79DRAFT_833771 [Phycomyces nitens]|nr:hypothetical protein CLU79DRAFT_833771 [Phycomyces nitens]
MRFQTLSLTAIGLLMFSSSQLRVNAEPFMLRDKLATVERDGAIHTVVSAMYLAPFSSDDAPEAEFELVDDDLNSHLLSYTKRGASCSKYATIKSGDTCTKVAKNNGISVSKFYDLNSQINSKCTNIIAGKKYCVKAGTSANVKAKTSSKKKTTKKTTKKKTTTKKKATKTTSKAKPSNKSVGSRKKIQSNSAFTYYWTAQEADYADNSKTVTIKTCSGKSIAKVDETYADALVMEGAGVVGNKLVNLGDCSCRNYNCFEELNKKENPFGLTSYGSALRPYTTIAANDIEKGTKIYVPALVGWELPGSSKKHNGCLLVDDESWSFTNKHIDFYVYEKDHYAALNKKHKVSKVDIYEGGDCSLLNYA